MKKIVFLLIIISVLTHLSKAQVPVWTELGTGASALKANGPIFSICADGNGNIYAAGDFTNSSGYYYVAKWDGTNWQEVKSNVSSLNANGPIMKILIDNNGNLYAAGNFTNTGNYRYVAKWDGNHWTELRSPSSVLDANACIVTLMDDANGNIYAAGWFTNTNGKLYVAKWNGIVWSELGSLDALNNPPTYYSEDISSLCHDNNGNIYAGGTFADSTGLYIVKWNGSNWTKLGDTHLWGAIMALATDNNGNVYAGTGTDDSTFFNFITVLKWDGAAWSVPGYGNAIQATADAQSFYIDSANNVYAAGNFIDASGYSCLAKWDGTTWDALGPICLSSSLQTPVVGGRDSDLSSIALRSVCMDHSGNLYTAGQFVDSESTFFVAKYIGSSTTGLPVISGNEPGIKVYPNPANDILNVEIEDNSSHADEMVLYDLLGRIMQQFRIPSGAQYASSISVSQLPAGNYILKIKGNNSYQVKEISVSH